MVSPYRVSNELVRNDVEAKKSMCVSHSRHPAHSLQQARSPLRFQLFSPFLLKHITSFLRKVKYSDAMGFNFVLPTSISPSFPRPFFRSGLYEDAFVCDHG